MFLHRIKNFWNQVKSNVSKRWDRLENYQAGAILKNRNHMTSMIHESYGIYRDEVEKHIAAWQERQKELKRHK